MLFLEPFLPNWIKLPVKKKKFMKELKNKNKTKQKQQQQKQQKKNTKQQQQQKKQTKKQQQQLTGNRSKTLGDCTTSGFLKFLTI